jgi:hypothetical protein
MRFCWFVESRGVPVAAWDGGVRDPVSSVTELSGKPPPATGGGRVEQVGTMQPNAGVCRGSEPSVDLSRGT